MTRRFLCLVLLSLSPFPFLSLSLAASLRRSAPLLSTSLLLAHLPCPCLLLSYHPFSQFAFLLECVFVCPLSLPPIRLLYLLRSLYVSPLALSVPCSSMVLVSCLVAKLSLRAGSSFPLGEPLMSIGIPRLPLAPLSVTYQLRVAYLFVWSFPR